MIPLFPLGTVLFPGLVLPLHIFEERYQQLVRDLLELPEAERQFGVVAIREGLEVGTDGIKALYEVGCTAQVREVAAYDDGRFDLVTVGVRLFRLREVHAPGPPPHLTAGVDGLHGGPGRPYWTAEVDWLPDEIGDAAQAQVLDLSVRVAFTDYLEALGAASGRQLETLELPDEPLVLSHLVAATTLLDLAVRQDLLDQPDGRSRLRRELTVLRREAGLLRALTAAPAPDLSRTPYSPN